MLNNQWELEGDCTKCRRQSYCTKECRGAKERSEAINARYDEMIRRFIIRRLFMKKKGGK